MLIDAQYFGAFTGTNNFVRFNIPRIREHLSGLHRQPQEFLAFAQRFFRPFAHRDVANNRNVVLTVELNMLEVHFHRQR